MDQSNVPLTSKNFAIRMQNVQTNVILMAFVLLKGNHLVSL